MRTRFNDARVRVSRATFWLRVHAVDVRCDGACTHLTTNPVHDAGRRRRAFSLSSERKMISFRLFGDLRGFGGLCSNTCVKETGHGLSRMIINSVIE